MNNKKIADNLGEENFLELLSILKKYLPEGMKVYLYGSRARGDNQKFSDVDLALEGDIDLSKLAELNLDLEESNLPFQVDVTRLNKISEDFLKLIEGDLVEIEI